MVFRHVGLAAAGHLRFHVAGQNLPQPGHFLRPRGGAVLLHQHVFMAVHPPKGGLFYQNIFLLPDVERSQGRKLAAAQKRRAGNVEASLVVAQQALKICAGIHADGPSCVVCVNRLLFGAKRRPIDGVQKALRLVKETKHFDLVVPLFLPVCRFQFKRRTALPRPRRVPAGTAPG